MVDEPSRRLGRRPTIELLLVVLRKHRNHLACLPCILVEGHSFRTPSAEMGEWLNCERCGKFWVHDVCASWGWKEFVYLVSMLIVDEGKVGEDPGVGLPTAWPA